MSPNPVVLSESASVLEAARAMADIDIGPVVETGRPVDVVSIGDLVLRPEAVPLAELRLHSSTS